jgi:hypothetical protein
VGLSFGNLLQLAHSAGAGGGPSSPVLDGPVTLNSASSRADSKPGRPRNWQPE